jgi:hypothetical protein
MGVVMKNCRKLQALEDLVEAVRQGIVVLDTVTFDVSRDHDHGRAPMNLTIVAKATQKAKTPLIEKAA